MRLMPVWIVLFLTVSGCGVARNGKEVAQTIWGSSTRALENARSQAIAKTYDKNYWDVMNRTLAACKKRGYSIFKKDEVKGYLVLIGIKGAVNTTEVGAFFVEINDSQTRLEFSSLSTNAKRLVAKAVFHDLDVDFGLAPPDPVEEPAADDKNLST
jgi:hypothetical protein